MSAPKDLKPPPSVSTTKFPVLAEALKKLSPSPTEKK